MTQLDTLRSNTAGELSKKLRLLDRRHRQLISEAIERYGSVAAVPQSVWDQIARDVENETAAALLILLLATDELTVRQIRRQGTAVSGASVASLSAYQTRAAEQAMRMARGTTETVRRRLAATVDAQAAVLRTKTPAEALRTVRTAVDEVFTSGRIERVTRTVVVNTTSLGQIGAARRASTAGGGVGQPAGGDGAAAGVGQRVRVELIWRIHPERSKSGTCPRCEAVSGTTEKVWGLVFPSGPGDEAHPNCNCELSPVAVVDRG